MAKSTRSKVKRAFRAKKRTEGVFAAADAARLQRLSAKLRAQTTAAAAAGDGGEDSDREEEQDVDMPVKDAGTGVDVEMESSPTAEGGKTTSDKPTTKISTHGPRGSRRERWRVSKGMTPRPKSRGLNRQGTVASRHKPGRSHRRR